MTRRLYIMTCTWIAEGNEVYVRVPYGVCASDAEARGKAMLWLDDHAPGYKQGSKFNMAVLVVDEPASRNLAAAYLNVDLDNLTEHQKFALLVLQQNDLTGAKALIDKLAEAGTINLDS